MNIKENIETNRKKLFFFLPPPNLTGILHVGHIFNAFINDFLYRYYNQKYDVDWKVMFDFAGQSVKSKVDSLSEKNISELRFEQHKDWKNVVSTLDCDEKIKKFLNYSGSIISKQFSKLDIKLDNEILYFTASSEFQNIMDRLLEQLSQGNYLLEKEKLNLYCYNCNKFLSERDVYKKNIKIKLYNIKYFIKKDNKTTDKYILISTTRPETILGDVCIITKFDEFHNLTVEIPLINKPIQCIKNSDYIIENLGTGNLKITPFHSIKDYITYHELQTQIHTSPVEIFDEDGKVAIDGFRNFDYSNLQDHIIEELQKQNLIDKIEEKESRLPLCSKCNSKCFLRRRNDIFIDLKRILKENLQQIKDLNILPAYREPEYLKWIDLCEEWCIIRANSYLVKRKFFICKLCHMVSTKSNYIKCKHNIIERDEYIDTWLLSSLCAVWYKEKFEFDESYVVTGYDILFFWIMKMIAISLFMKKIPVINKIFVHGLIRDKHGRKMSKSLGNSPDIFHLLDQFGETVVRFYLLSEYHSEKDVHFKEHNIKLCEKFIFKVINSFTLIHKILNFSDKQSDKQDNLFFNTLKQKNQEWNKLIESGCIAIFIESFVNFYKHDFCNVFLTERKSKTYCNQVFIDICMNIFKYINFIMPTIWTIRDNEIFRYLIKFINKNLSN